MRTNILSVVVPVFNEEEVLPEFHKEVCRVLNALEGMQYEIVYVNDGSTDRSALVMQQLRAIDGRVALVDLSRNFGKEIALTAGLDHASGDAVVVIDADLQDPPALIPELVKHWKAGFDVVYAKRTMRDGETIIKKATAHMFYRLIRRVTRLEIPEDTGDFRLLSRRAVDALKELREQHRFMKGLFAWIGFPQKEVLYRRQPRFAGRTKWNYWHLWTFAIEGFTSFSIAPLKVSSYLGLLTALAAFVYAMFVIYKTIVFGEAVRGYASLMVVILFLGGIQLMALGIIGEYLGRTFNEAKRRPLYFVKLHQSAQLQNTRNDASEPEAVLPPPRERGALAKWQPPKNINSR